MPGATEKLFQVTGHAMGKNLSAASVKEQGIIVNLGSAKYLSSLMPVAELLSYAVASAALS